MLLAFKDIALPVGIPGLVILLAIVWRQKRSLSQLFYFSIFWIYIVLLIGATIFPVPFLKNGDERQPALYILSRVNLVPLHFGGLFNLHPNIIFRELLGNILLTVPIGFGIPFLSGLREKQIPWLAMGVGLSIELTQLMISLWIGSAYRGVDINDVLLNAAGVMLGYVFFRVCTWLITTLRLL